MKRQANDKKNHKKLDTSKGIELNCLCDKSYSKIMDLDNIKDDIIKPVDLCAVFKNNLHIRGYVDYYGGYAEHCRNVIDGLSNLHSYNIKLTPIKTPVDVDPIVWSRMNGYVNNPAYKNDNTIFLTIAGPGWLQEKFLKTGAYNIGWTMIETCDYNKECIPWLGNVNELWCPTDADVTRAKRCDLPNTEIVKMHLGYDQVKYNDNTYPYEIEALKKRYVFGVLGSWNCRKGVKDIIKAYCNAFTKYDNTTLLFVSKYGTRPYNDSKYDRKKVDEESTAEEKNKWTISWEFNKIIEELDVCKDNLPHIAIIDVPLHENVIPHIVSRFDCLVGFSKGESTWLPGLQCMAMGIPIIQLENEYAGYHEYLHDVAFYCRQVEYKESKEEDYLGTSEYYEGEYFADGDYLELAYNMRSIYSMGCPTLEKRVINGVKKAKDWTWNKATEKIHERLQKLFM